MSGPITLREYLGPYETDAAIQKRRDVYKVKLIEQLLEHKVGGEFYMDDPENKMVETLPRTVFKILMHWSTNNYLGDCIIEAVEDATKNKGLTKVDAQQYLDMLQVDYIKQKFELIDVLIYNIVIRDGSLLKHLSRNSQNYIVRHVIGVKIRY